MSEESPPYGSAGSSPLPPPRPGLGDLTSSTFAALLKHLLLRVKLFQLEAQEIRGELLLKLFVLLTAFLFFALAYVTMLAGAIAMLSIHFQWTWHKVLLCTGGAHLLIAFFLIMLAKKGLSHAAFRDSLKEIEKDRQWLENKQHHR
ncbi:MAG: phage holin family protein [Verrucomicrobiales bacterium]|nr:phage holin family protein [Verrucomicrobiales bacterium]